MTKKDKECGALLGTAVVFGGILGGVIGALIGYIIGKGWT